MLPELTVEPDTIHLWAAELPMFTVDERFLLSLLSPDEVERARRFHLLLHRQRFILTRGLLRKTLSFYTGTAPERIVFTYGPHGKPYLYDNPLGLQFNVSHSADFTVFALISQQEVGVDIEKIKPGFNEKIAKRFFSQQEYTQLLALPADKQNEGFYQVWAKKEAILKLAGHGVFMSFVDFSVSLINAKESIELTHLQHQSRCYVENFSVTEGYQAAFATCQQIVHLKHWQCSL